VTKSTQVYVKLVQSGHNEPPIKSVGLSFPKNAIEVALTPGIGQKYSSSRHRIENDERDDNGDLQDFSNRHKGPV